MASGDAPTLEGLACMHFSRASSVLNVTKAHTQRLCPESSLLALMDSCSCCTFFCTCIAALTCQSCLSARHIHTHAHTQPLPPPPTDREKERETHTDTRTHTRTHARTHAQTLGHTHCSFDIYIRLCVSLTVRLSHRNRSKLKS